MGSSPPPPIFETRLDLDPFYLYGKKEMDDDSDEEALRQLSEDAPLRVRLKQVLMDQREDSFVKASSLKRIEESLDHIIKFESGQHPIDGSVLYDNETHIPKDARCKRSEMHLDQKIIASLSQISVVFSQIFQVLFCLIENSGNQAGSSPLQVEKLSKRSKEFDVRLNRSVFDMKQKANASRISILKLNLNPLELSLQRKADLHLLRVLRCAQSMLRSFLSHLPLTDHKNIFSQSVERAIPEIALVAHLALELGYDAQEFKKDVSRLEVASEKFQRHQAIKWKEEHEFKSAQEHSHKLKSRKKQTLNMIDNLAREKFGTGSPPKSPKKTNLKVPKYTFPHKKNLFEEDSFLAPRQKFGLPPNVNRKSLALKHSLKDRVNAEHEDDVSNNFSDSMHHSEPRQMEKTEKTVLKEYRGRGKRGHVILDLADDELLHILRHRREFELKLANINLELISNPTKFVCKLTKKIADEIVKDVCIEMLNGNIIANLMDTELKE